VGVVTGLVLVGLGGVAGALARHSLGRRVERHTLDTLAVNVLGSFVLGALLAAPVPESLLLLAGTGFCGAFTTFSTFAFETVRLAEAGDPGRAAANAAVNLAGAVGAVLLGGALAGVAW
jgi:CrcB protein